MRNNGDSSDIFCKLEILFNVRNRTFGREWWKERNKDKSPFHAIQLSYANSMLIDARIDRRLSRFSKSNSPI